MQHVQVFPSVLMIWLFLKDKAEIIAQAEEEVREIETQYSSGLVTKVSVTIKLLIFGRVPMNKLRKR